MSEEIKNQETYKKLSNAVFSFNLLMKDIAGYLNSDRRKYHKIIQESMERWLPEVNNFYEEVKMSHGQIMIKDSTPINKVEKGKEIIFGDVTVEEYAYPKHNIVYDRSEFTGLCDEIWDLLDMFELEPKLLVGFMPERDLGKIRHAGHYLAKGIDLTTNDNFYAYEVIAGWMESEKKPLRMFGYTSFIHVELFSKGPRIGRLNKFQTHKSCLSVHQLKMAGYKDI